MNNAPKRNGIGEDKLCSLNTSMNSTLVDWMWNWRENHIMLNSNEMISDESAWMLIAIWQIHTRSIGKCTRNSNYTFYSNAYYVFISQINSINNSSSSDSSEKKLNAFKAFGAKHDFVQLLPFGVCVCIRRLRMIHSDDVSNVPRHSS